MERLIKITKCRLCNSDNIVSPFSFGEIALANSYIKPEDLNKQEFKATLSPAICKECGHLQILETIDPKILFENYLYSSSTSPGLVKHFEQYAKDLFKNCNLKKGSFVLDIGSNDGISLNEFKKLGCRVLGVEPAKNMAKVARSRGIITLNRFFNSDTAVKILNVAGRPDLIISNNTYAHLAEHQEVTIGIKYLLNDQNCFVFENAYALDTLEKMYFDQFYHEHLSYHSVNPLLNYFDSFGCRIFNVEHNEVQGGTIRVYVCDNGNAVYKAQDSVSKFLIKEHRFKLHEPSTLVKFYDNIHKIQSKFCRILDELIKSNKTISCYGCPAKFALFSKIFGLNKENIQYVVEDSPFKQGLYTPESKIKIVNKQYFIDNPTDVCIVSAWNFEKQIKSINLQYTGQWINPFNL